MRKAVGILMIIGAVPLAVLGVLSVEWRDVVLVLARSLPPLLILLLAFFLGFWGYRTLKRRK